jgi:DNA-binding NtrC family response regulator
LLRMLEERTIRRIGGKKEISVDIRVVSATNRNVEEQLEQGFLREDLFYRINTIRIHIPPLRERIDDIPLLIQHFLGELNQKYNRGIQGLTPVAMDVLQSYAWPGNVRELQNVTERTYYMANPPLIKPTDLPSNLNRNNHSNQSNDKWENLDYRDAKERAIADFERNYLLYHLDRQEWNISRTAENCGMDRRTLHRLIKRYDLKKQKLENE